MKTVDARSGGLGDCIVALWIAQGIIEAGDEVGFLGGVYRDIVTAFGFKDVFGEISDVLGVGGSHPSYVKEIEEGPDGRDRAVRWQDTVSWGYKPRRPRLEGLPLESLGWARNVAAERRTEANKPLALIFPRANYDSRSWPIGKWVRLAHHMEQEGWATITLDRNSTHIRDMPFQLWGFSYSHIMALMLEADIVVGNDSGMQHLAGTLGTPTAAVMGPTDPQTVFGYCEDIYPVFSDDVPCTGCHFRHSKGYNDLCDKHGCDSLATLAYMKVYRKVQSVYEARRQGASAQVCGLPSTDQCKVQAMSGMPT